jgi:V/A-type H+-transporting ATPase subunit I
MARVAVVAPTHRLRDVLAAVADSGVVELDDGTRRGDETHGPAAQALQRVGGDRGAGARVALVGSDIPGWEAADRVDLLLGEAALEDAGAYAVTRGRAAAIAGWCARQDLAALRGRVAHLGAAVVELARPTGVQPPTRLVTSGPVSRPFSPLISTYATVPYRDLDPTIPAGLAYVLMFGMMFGDVGHGLLLVAAGVALAVGRPRHLVRIRPQWPLVAGAGAVATGFGFLYGEAFGPTGLVPVLWLSPLEEPVPLLAAAVGLGAVLLAGAYALGTVNRFREGGWRSAVYEPSGLAGATLFLGAALAGAGWFLDLGTVVTVGLVLAVAALVVTYIGLVAAAGGRGTAFLEAVVELLDVVVRLGSNIASFARLAAFGLTHAALGLVVWQATTALWGGGGAAVVWAVVVFVLGNALAFTLEALVAGIQALRLEYYELFSRIFNAEGRPFRPFHIPADDTTAGTTADSTTDTFADGPATRPLMEVS